jgi:hypothetical protein
MEQHVRGPTHVAGHTLDVLITRDTDTIVSTIEVNDPGLSDSDGKISRDHFAVIFHIRAEKPAPIRKTVTYRKLRSIDIESFRNDIKSLNNSLASLVDKHTPLLTKQVTLRPWYNEELHEAKHLKRKLERKWRKTNLTVDHEIYRNQCASVNKFLKQTRVKFYSEKIESCGRDQKTLFKVTKNLLGRNEEAVLPTSSSSKELAQNFSDFFI